MTSLAHGVSDSIESTHVRRLDGGCCARHCMKGEGSEVMSLVRTFLDGVVGLLIQGDFLLL